MKKYKGVNLVGMGHLFSDFSDEIHVFWVAEYEQGIHFYENDPFPLNRLF